MLKSRRRRPFGASKGRIALTAAGPRSEALYRARAGARREGQVAVAVRHMEVGVGTEGRADAPHVLGSGDEYVKRPLYGERAHGIEGDGAFGTVSPLSCRTLQAASVLPMPALAQIPRGALSCWVSS